MDFTTQRDDDVVVVAPYAWLSGPAIAHPTAEAEYQPVQTCSIPAELAYRYQQTELVSDACNLPIQYMGITPVFDDPRLYSGRESDWVMMNLAEDPLFLDDGPGLVMPAPVIADINRVLEAGVDFDALFIAHEIPRGSLQSGEAVPLDLVAPPPPAGVSERLNRLNRVIENVWDGARTTAGFTAKATAATAAGVAVAGIAVARGALALTALDPILFGVFLDRKHTVRGQPLGLWYYVSHWTWNKED